ncbi:RusA family crossover junction endodeoxyribonuclease [Streptomyces fungicidicus]|uniref:RusA family crossover junction endodeoxyribonuclease n=1 Tax=Streptomyces fungicidicus TaxID=68203 RepID=UPI00367B012C
MQAENRKVIDADNAAKAILDTLQGFMILNDSAIQHVSAYRMKAPATKGYYLIGLRPVHPLEADIIAHSTHAKDVSPLMRLQDEE